MSETPADDFSSLWDVPPDVFAFLGERPDATLRQRADVVAVDQFRRWRAGKPLLPEEYLERLEDLANDEELTLELVLREFEYARLYAQRPDVEEFARRFPDLRDRLIESIAGNEESSTSSPPGDREALEPTLAAGDPMFGTSASRQPGQPDQEHRPQVDPVGTLGAGGEKSGSAETTGLVCQPPDTERPAPFLAQCDAFASLPGEVLRMIESNMTPRRWGAGEYILRQGEPGTSLMVISEGVVEITTDDEDGSRHFIGRIGRGQVLGEMSLLTEEPRTADAVATSTVETLVLPVGKFHELATLFPSISIVLTRLFATRLGGVGRDVLAGKTFGGYRFDRHLGQGGMGVVYEAHHVETGRVVALKMMSHRLVYDAVSLENFQREADIIESFEHPNIVKTYGRFAAFHTYFIAMQFCDGNTLEEVVNANGPLPEAEFRKIIGQVAAALDHAHAQGVIHRDVKPANIMLNRDGTVKLMDFGLAKPIEDDPQAYGPRPVGLSAGGIVGTLRYMAPEQLGGLAVGKEADYFSLGCAAYKVLTGNNLFNGSGVQQVRREHANFKTPDFRVACPNVSIATSWFLDQCLQREPADRRPNLQKVASWAAPFPSGLLAKVAADLSEQVVSEETLVE